MHRRPSTGTALGFACLAAAGAIAVSTILPAAADTPQVLTAQPAGSPIEVDGELGEWRDIEGITVALAGRGGVDSVELKAAIRGDRIYLMASWRDNTESRLHKPYRWDEASQSYGRTKQLEDRFAVSLAMTGAFSASKLEGAEFTADVWHWKASRSDPAGVAHDKMWQVSRSEFPKSKKFRGADGQPVWVARPSDAGDRLYRPVTPERRDKEIMPRYEVNPVPQGSIADVAAKGVWRDGRWYLEMSRKLDTGNADDAVIPQTGEIEIAVAAFNDVDGRSHSTSGMIVLRTLAGMN